MQFEATSPGIFLSACSGAPSIFAGQGGPRSEAAVLAEFAEEPSIGDILELIHTVEMAAAVPLFAGQSQNNAESTYLEAKIEHATLGTLGSGQFPSNLSKSGYGT